VHDSICRDMIHNAVEEGVLDRRDIMLFQVYKQFTVRGLSRKKERRAGKLWVDEKSSHERVNLLQKSNPKVSFKIRQPGKGKCGSLIHINN
jgi:hypothetical protein